jgi:hypothetical protein
VTKYDFRMRAALDQLNAMREFVTSAVRAGGDSNVAFDAELAG